MKNTNNCPYRLYKPRQKASITPEGKWSQIFRSVISLLNNILQPSEECNIYSQATQFSKFKTMQTEAENTAIIQVNSN